MNSCVINSHALILPNAFLVGSNAILVEPCAFSSRAYAFIVKPYAFFQPSYVYNPHTGPKHTITEVKSLLEILVETHLK